MPRHLVRIKTKASSCVANNNCSVYNLLVVFLLLFPMDVYVNEMKEMRSSEAKDYFLGLDRDAQISIAWFVVDKLKNNLNRENDMLGRIIIDALTELMDPRYTKYEASVLITL